MVKSNNSTPGGRSQLSSITESTSVPGVSGGVSAAEPGVWMHDGSSRIRDAVVPQSSDITSNDSSDSCVRHDDAEVTLIIIIKS